MNAGDDETFAKAVDRDVLAVGAAPAEAVAMLDGTMAHALGLAMYNAVQAQQNAMTLRAAVVAMACAAIAEAGVLPPDATPAPAPAPAPPKPPSTKDALADAGVPKTAATSVNPEVVEAPQAAHGPVTVDPQVVNALNLLNQLTMEAPQIVANGAGKAYQLAALNAALTIQDAADALRGVSTVATAAAGAALAKYLATGDRRDETILAAAQQTIAQATVDYSAIGAAAAKVIQAFPVEARG